VLTLSRRYAHRRYARLHPGTGGDEEENLCADLRRFRVPRTGRTQPRSAP
jgi:hypothetical protein